MFRSVLLIAVAVASAAFFAGTSRNVGAQAPQFRAGVELVQLDVSVLDHDRQPVRGLTASDFTVAIDGRAARVVAFQAVDLRPAPSLPTAPWLRDVASDVASNAAPAGRVIAIVIDDNSFADARIGVVGVRRAKDTALAIVNELGPEDRAAVVFTGNGRTAQPFTSDRQLLRTAIEKASIFAVDEIEDYSRDRDFCYCGLCSFETLGRVAESLRPLQERRKILAYVSAGSYFDIPQSARRDECAQSKRDAERAAIRQAHFANVTIQAFDPKGLAPPSARGGARGAPPSPASSERLRFTASARLESLRTIADSTGGRAILNNNRPDLQVPSALAESSSYYLLGVERPATREEGRLRRLDVRVGRTGVTVRTRAGYYDPTRREIEATAQLTASGDPTKAILGALPESTVPLDLVAVPFPTATGQSALAMVVGITRPEAERVAARVGDIEILTHLFNLTTGESAVTRRQRLDVAWSRPGVSIPYYEVLSGVVAKPGRYELRVALRVEDGRTAGVYTSVELPNFGDEFSVSGLVLSVEPAPRSGPPDAFRDVLPITPTARRVFRRTDRVTTFLQVQQNTAAFARTTVTTRLTDAGNKIVFDGVTELNGIRNEIGSTAIALGDIPVGTLTPGDYLLTIDVASGERIARRTSRFKVE